MNMANIAQIARNGHAFCPNGQTSTSPAGKQARNTPKITKTFKLH